MLGAQLEFLSILKERQVQKNLTVIMSLHELELAKIISDKILCLKGEYIEKYGTPEEVFETEFIRKLYDIDDEILLKDAKFLTYVRQISSSD